MEVGGTLTQSARYAVQINFLDVARIRADPLLIGPGARSELIEMLAAARVPKITVPPGTRLTEVATASLIDAPPAKLKISTPSCMVAESVEVQEKNVPKTPF